MKARELAAEYVLGTLDERGREEVELRLATDPELRAEVEAMAALGGELAELPTTAWPDPASASASPPSGRREQARRWTLRPAFALAAVVLALAIGVGAGLLLDGGGGGGEEPVLAELPLRALPGAAAGSGTVAMPKADEMLLTVDRLPPSKSGQYYELWLLGEDEETVPVASFHVGADGTARVRVPLPTDPSGYRYFDVSRQAVSDGTAHSGDSVLRGPT